MASVFSRTSGRSGKALGDLRGALEVEALVVAHPLRVVAVLAQADAQQDVVGLVVLGLEEVGVVGGHHRQAQLVGQGEDLPVELGLPLGVVGLHLQVVAAVEEVGVPLGGLAGAVHVVGHEVAGHLPGQARRGDDDALVVPGQHLPVHAGPVVEALGVPDGGELHQVAVAHQVPGQEHQVVVGALALAGAGAVPAVAGRHVGLHADDGLEAFLARGLVEGPGAEHAAVVREGQARASRIPWPVRTRSPMRLAPSRREYSEWVWRWTKLKFLPRAAGWSRGDGGGRTIVAGPCTPDQSRGGDTSKPCGFPGQSGGGAIGSRRRGVTAVERWDGAGAAGGPSAARPRRARKGWTDTVGGLYCRRTAPRLPAVERSRSGSGCRGGNEDGRDEGETRRDAMPETPAGLKAGTGDVVLMVGTTKGAFLFRSDAARGAHGRWTGPTSRARRCTPWPWTSGRAGRRCGPRPGTRSSAPRCAAPTTWAPPGRGRTSAR